MIYEELNGKYLIIISDLKKEHAIKEEEYRDNIGKLK